MEDLATEEPKHSTPVIDLSGGQTSLSSKPVDRNDSVNSVDEKMNPHGNVFTDAFRSITSMVWQQDTPKPPEYDDMICPICLETYKGGEEVCQSTNDECPHSFHLDCMMKWLIMHDNCPLCRADYLNIADKEGEGGAGSTVNVNNVNNADDETRTDIADGTEQEHP